MSLNTYILNIYIKSTPREKVWDQCAPPGIVLPWAHLGVGPREGEHTGEDLGVRLQPMGLGAAQREDCRDIGLGCNVCEEAVRDGGPGSLIPGYRG